MQFYDIPLIILFVIGVLMLVGYYMVKCCRWMNEFNFVEFVGWKNTQSQPQAVADPESNVPNTSDEDFLHNSHSGDPAIESVNSVRNRTTAGFENNGYLDEANELIGARERVDSKETNSTTESTKELRLSDLRENLLMAGVQEVSRSNTLQCLRDPRNNFAGPFPTAASSLDNEQRFAGEILNITIPRYVGFSDGLNNEIVSNPTLNPPGLYYLPRSFHAIPFVRAALNDGRPTLNGPLLNRLGLRLNGLRLGASILNRSQSNESSLGEPVLMPEHIDEVLVVGENFNAGNAAVDNLGIGEAGIGEAGIGEAGIGEEGIGEAGIGEEGIGEAGIGGSNLTDSINLNTASSENLSTYCQDTDSLSTDSVFV